jgi:hypothetical protein
MPASVWIINLVVLGAVYEADLGHRKITLFRLVRPLLLAAGIVLLLQEHRVGHGALLTMMVTPVLMAVVPPISVATLCSV